jgi:glycine/D-amino acid oxidase-like deaminating enzyme
MSSEVPHSADVVVVGGGVFGCSAALHLMQAGAGKVVLIERTPSVARQTTYAGAGFVSLWSAGDAQPEYEIEQYGRAFYVRLAEAFDIGLKRVGLLFIALTQAAAARQHTHHAETKLRLHAGEVNWVDPARVDALAPIFAPGSIASAEHWPHAVGINAALATQAMAQQFMALGGQVCGGVTLLSVNVLADQVHSVETSAGVIHTRCVVNAAGAWAGRIAGALGVHLPLLPTQVSRFVTQPISGLAKDLPLLLIHDYCGLYLREHEGGLLIGSDQTLMHGPQLITRAAQMMQYDTDRDNDLPDDVCELPNDIALFNQFAAQMLAAAIPALGKFQIKETRHGLPVRTPDMRPVLGEARRVRGFYVMSGDNECGVTRGPGLGKLLAELILQGKTSADIAPLSMNRFGGGYG